MPHMKQMGLFVVYQHFNQTIFSRSGLKPSEMMLCTVVGSQEGSQQLVRIAQSQSIRVSDLLE